MVDVVLLIRDLHRFTEEFMVWSIFMSMKENQSQ